MKVQDLTDALLEYMPDADVDIILNAYIYSAKAHRGQSRRSGEAYFSHPLEVAHNLVKLKLDATTVAAGLLHDTIEDTLSTPEEIQELFGDEIFQLWMALPRSVRSIFPAMKKARQKTTGR